MVMAAALEAFTFHNFARAMELKTIYMRLNMFMLDRTTPHAVASRLGDRVIPSPRTVAFPVVIMTIAVIAPDITEVTFKYPDTARLFLKSTLEPMSAPIPEKINARIGHQMSCATREVTKVIPNVTEGGGIDTP